MFPWILAIVLGFVAWVFMKVVAGPVRRSLTGRQARLSDSLSEFDGARGADMTLGPEAKESVAQMYERMCVLEPSKWHGDPRIPEIVRRYGDIVSGREPDPEGRSVPSAWLFNRPNPDYLRYLRNQNRLRGGDGMSTAYKWARREKQEHGIREGFGDVLLQMGMTENLLPHALTDERLDSYEEEDWRAVVKAMLAVSERYGEDLAVCMLDIVPDAERLCSNENAEILDALRKQDVDIEVCKAVLLGHMTVEQAERAAELVEVWKYTWQQAVHEVVSADITVATDEILRQQYAEQVRSSRRKV